MKTPEMMYIVTAIDRNKGYRCNISIPLQKDKALHFYTEQMFFMRHARPELRYLSDYKIETI